MLSPYTPSCSVVEGMGKDMTDCAWGDAQIVCNVLLQVTLSQSGLDQLTVTLGNTWFTLGHGLILTPERHKSNAIRYAMMSE